MTSPYYVRHKSKTFWHWIVCIEVPERGWINAVRFSDSGQVFVETGTRTHYGPASIRGVEQNVRLGHWVVFAPGVMVWWDEERLW